MSDEKNQVSDQAGVEGELPTPSFSEKATSSPSDADAIVSKLTPILEQIVERKVQSVKDKRFSEIEKALGGRAKLLAELEGEGVTIPKEVRNEIRMRELEERFAQPTEQLVSSKADGSTEQRQAVTDAIAELTKYDLNSNDPGFIELLRGQYPSKEAFDAKVQRYILSKVAPHQAPSPAGFVQAPATGGNVPKGVDALTDEYKQKVRSNRGNRSLINDLREEYKKKGVDVYSIDFS